MKKIDTLKIFLFIPFLFLTNAAWSQTANISYEVRVNSIYSTDGSSISGSSCWESTDEEYTANVRIDGPTTGTNFCMTDPGSGGSSTYGAGTVLRTSTNVAATSFTVVYDIFEDDGGVRCTFDSGDDCRANSSYSVAMVNTYAPTAANTYTNATNNQVYNSGSSVHEIRLNNSWRYNATTANITPTCTAQTAAYSSGAIRSWAVSLTAGVAYNFNNCTSTSNDTYMRIYGIDGYTAVAINDDNCGLLSSITYTPTTTGMYCAIST